MSLHEKLTREEFEEVVESLQGRKDRFPSDDEQLEKDPIVQKVKHKFDVRSQLGITKYGTTLQDNDLTLFEWLNHIQEELMDATLYIEKLKSQFKNM